MSNEMDSSHRPPRPSPEPIGDAVGAPLPRLEARRKATGQAVYTDDMHLPGMLHGAVLGSPHAHARIVSVDTSQAAALPGVKAVISAADLPVRLIGPGIQDEPAIARDRARYVGEPVAAVAAVDRDTARAALALIQVEYEALEPVFDPEQALDPDAPVLHPDRNSYFCTYDLPEQLNAASVTVVREGAFRHGDNEHIWNQCDVIVEGVYETPVQYHMYIEPVATVAAPTPDGKLTIWTATQSLFRVQQIVAHVLDLPMPRVRVIGARVGGAFGGKTEATNQPIAAALARAANAPVKLTMSRQEDITTMKTRHACRIYMRTGARQNGKLRAREIRMYYDTGAYADDGPFVAGFGAYFGCGGYRIPHVSIEAYSVYTNRTRASAFRGFGSPQVTFASEQQVDEIADRLGMDPIELREKNAVKTGELFLGGGSRVESGTLKECLEVAREESGWDQRRAQSTPSGPGKRRGIGMAGVAHVSAMLGTTATVKLNEDGTLTLNTGAMDLGQGSDTALVQCASGALGVPVEHINYPAQDTDTSPYDWTTASSRVTFVVGNAVVDACREVEEQILDHAGAILECSPRDLELRPGGRVGVKGVPGRETSFLDVAVRALYTVGGPIQGTSSYFFAPPGMDSRHAYIRGYTANAQGFFTFGAVVAEVEVDELTGQVELIEAWCVHDVGRAINRAGVEGQILGGFVQGLGYALYEELLWDPAGRVRNDSMNDYKVPRFLDVPRAIHPIIVEIPHRDGPFGAKGIGEHGVVAVAAAVCNAVKHATGARITTIPATPERVLDALAALEA